MISDDKWTLTLVFFCIKYICTRRESRKLFGKPLSFTFSSTRVDIFDIKTLGELLHVSSEDRMNITPIQTWNPKPLLPLSNYEFYVHAFKLPVIQAGPGRVHQC